MPAEVKRYHSALIALHWLLAIAILLAIVFGGFVLDSMDNANVHKPGLLRMHVTLGVLILSFTAVRLLVRAGTAKPAPLVSGKPLMDKVAIGIHHLLYTLTFVVGLAGLALAYKAGLFGFLYQHSGSLPKDFEEFAAHSVHGLAAYALLGVAVLHAAGAMQHQFILKDGIFSRMSLRAKE